jgi:acetolactate synthase I/II/III large subunit
MTDVSKRGSERLGGQILIDALIAQGATVAFGVPGESYLAALDGMYHRRNAFRFIVCRQEGGAAFMAEAWGKVTGEPGIAFVTRGPGACNASIGVHTALQDSTPMILLVGQIERTARDREAFQEIDYRAMFGSVAKWVGEIDTAARIPEYVRTAFHVAQSGRPGPVVLALPEDMLMEKAEVVDLPRVTVPASAADPAAMRRVDALLKNARRPLLVLGGSRWSLEASTAIEALATDLVIPTACGFRRQDRIDNRSAAYVGHLGVGADPSLLEYISEADLIISLGGRLGEITSNGYSIFSPDRYERRLVTIHCSPDEVGRTYSTDLAIQADPNSFLEMSRYWAAPSTELLTERRRWMECGRARYSRWIEPRIVPGELQIAEVIRHIRDACPHDTIVTNGAGNYAAFVHRYWSYRRFGTQVAPTNGAMGYGVPAAIAAQLARPRARVVSFSGDGCFLMNGQELSIAAQRQLPILFVVINNGMYGTIRMHQERTFPGHVSGTDLHNPDFAAFARSFGVYGVQVRGTGEFDEALREVLAKPGPSLIECIVDSEALTPAQSLSEIRASGSRQAA